ncbi:MAG: OmpH family outer membrane protein [Nitrospiraceae bacterium]|nr:MAG: OmpH family outer membrane protein [Nitrospiraceae bacterium]
MPFIVNDGDSMTSRVFKRLPKASGATNGEVQLGARGRVGGRGAAFSDPVLEASREPRMRGSSVIQVGVVRRKVLGIGSLLIALLAVVGCAAGVANKVEGKIGVVDAARLLNETNVGKKAKDSLNAFSKNRQALIELDEKELRRMEEDFGRQASVLSPTAKREREEQFRRRVAEYQQKASDMNREVQEKQKDVLEGFREKVGLMVEKVSKRLGLQVVIDKGKGGPTLYSDEGLDITGQIIDEFNREYP